MYQLKDGIFPFKVPAIHIANNSPHVTPTSFSLSASQRLFTFCCTGRYKYSTPKKSSLFMHNVNLNLHPQQFCYKRPLS